MPSICRQQDAFWGKVEGADGLNHLGRLLMQIRQDLQGKRMATPYDEELGQWLSAALGDPNSCDKFKAVITKWFDSLEWV